MATARQEISALAGKLSSEAETTQLPNVTKDVKPRSLNRRPVYVYYLSSAEKSVSHNNRMLVYHISQFYATPAGARALPADCVGAMLGMLLNIAIPSQVLDGGISATFRDTGYDLDVRRLTRRELDQLIELEPKYDIVAELIGDFNHRIARERDLFLVISAVILLVIGKQVNSEGYEGWYKNRIATFCGSLGYSHGTSVLQSNTRPNRDCMLGAYQFLSATRNLRSEIFKVYIAASKNDDRQMGIFKDICKLLYWTEMTHISLIDEMLYRKYKELLSIRVLAQESTPMMEAWNYLSTKSPEERKFCKLLFSKEETSVLNRARFSLYCDVALAAKQFEQPSLRNYKGATQNQEIKTKVHNYLAIRTRLLDYSLADSEHAHFTEEERVKYLESVIADLNAEEASAQRT